MQFRTGDGSEMISLAGSPARFRTRSTMHRYSPRSRSLLGAYDQALIEDPEGRDSRLLLMLATAVARTPDVPLAAATLAVVELPDQAQAGECQEFVDLVDRTRG